MCDIFIVGPCAIDSAEQYLRIADELSTIMEPYDEWYYKASFDKANRTSIHGDRGVGLDEGLALFREVKKRYPGIKLTTDVHECWQVELLAGVIDCIQIPAFLSRQTDLIVECAKHFPIVNIKKMQHLGPNNLIKSVDKIKETNPDCKAWLTDRGSNYGYDHLIVDYTIVDELKKYYDAVILDATHSAQRSRQVYGTQGDVKMCKRYLLSAAIFGYSGVFAETHYDPQSSSSDKDTQIPLDKLAKLLETYELIGALDGC